VIDECRWIVQHARIAKYVYYSTLSTDEILRTVAHDLGPRANRSGYLSRGSFEHYMDDFDDNGDSAIESRGLWGQIRGTTFELAAASGYRAHQYIVPWIRCSLSPSGAYGSRIQCRVKSIQRGHVLLFLAMFIAGPLCLGFGTSLTLNGSTRVGGFILVAFGGFSTFMTFYIIHIVTPIAQHMLS
jgi:hypothetical protein